MRLALLLALLVPTALAQPVVPDDGPFGGALPTASIEIHPDTLAAILAPENQQSDVEYRALFTWTDADGDDAVEEVGFRLRGNTSREAAKKSFKVSFNTYRPGREWRSLDKLNLNGEHNDPTVLRSAVAWGLAREMRIPGARAHPVRLVINGDFFGVYANVEHIDDEFLTSHFRDDRGTLYKCLFPADLDFLGTDPQLYRDLAPFGRPAYELKEGSGDHVDLAAFIDVLNNTPDADFPDAIERALDVNGYLRALAFDILTGNWDGYAYNQNNYYLYFDPEIGAVRYIPYDLDNTLGIDFLDRDWGTRGVYDWPRGPLSGEPPRPLAKRLLRVPDYRDRLSFYLARALDGPYRADALTPRIEALRALIEDEVALDPYYPLDYGWDIGDFRDAFTQALGGHVDYGLIPFAETRGATALAELESVDVAPLLSEARTDPSAPLPGAAVRLSVWVEDEAAPARVEARVRVDGGAWTTLSMDTSGGGVWFTELGAFAEGAVVEYVVEAEDAGGQVRTEPRAGDAAPRAFTVARRLMAGVHINELLASNDTVLADEAGEFDDWIEIHNSNDIPITLGGAYLTDDPTDPTRFALPDVMIPEGGFLIIWADDDTEQGPLHAPFKLSAGGEEVALFVGDGAGGLALADYVAFGEQETDVAFGRSPDGADAFAFFEAPTPGASNAGTTDAEDAPAPAALTLTGIAPNPAPSAFAVTLALGAPATVEGDVVDALGRVVARVAPREADGALRLALPALAAAGVYTVRLRAHTADGTTHQASRRVTVVR